MIGSICSQLLSTKLNPPLLRPVVVDRRRLISALNTGLWQKLTLICGPAGSGKSTLLSLWLSEQDIPSSWLSLDEGDDEPIRFINYLIEALRKLSPRMAKEFNTCALGSGQFDTLAFTRDLLLPALIGDDLKCILVLDDFHCIKNSQIKEALRMLLEHSPEGFHIAISSRSEPELNLSRFRVKGQLNEIRAQELCFQEEEAIEFYNTVMGLHLDPSMVKAVELYTDGWIAACQLTALSLLKSAYPDAVMARLSKGSQLVTEYLAEEILQHLSPAIRNFLITTSVANRLCDPLCEFLIGDDQQTIPLKVLEKENLFVYPLDDQGLWYRYHPLFAGFLRERLATQAPERLKVLHRKASEWFAGERMMHEAAEHLIAARDQPDLVRFIESQFIHILLTGELYILQSCLDAIDEKTFAERPTLALSRAACNFVVNSDIDQIELSIDSAENTLRSNSDRLLDDLAINLRTTIKILRALTALRRGNYGKARELAESARGELHEELIGLDTTLVHVIALSHASACEFNHAIHMMDYAQRAGFESGQYMVAFSAMATKAVVAFMKLNLHEAHSIITDGLQIAQDKGCGLLPVVGGLHVELGQYHFYCGQFSLAEAEIEEGIRRCNVLKINDGIVTGYCLLARIKLYRKDVDGARKDLEDAKLAAKYLDNRDMKAVVLSYEALLDLQSGDLKAAQKWVDEKPAEEISNLLLREQINVIRLTVSYYSGQHDTLLGDIQESIHRISHSGLLLFVVILRILKAVTLLRLERSEEASGELEKAAEMAMPEGLQVYFKLWGDVREWTASIRKLVGGIQKRRIKDYVVALIGADSDEMANAEVSSNVDLSNEMIDQTDTVESEPLSERELEVLRLISKGMSNNDIASKLFVSLNTVKTHIQRIFRKLNVKNRTAAVREARRKNLISI